MSGSNLDRDEAERYVDAFNSHRPSMYDELSIEEFPIGTPRVDYDGLVWAGKWTTRRKVKGERQIVMSDGKITVTFPNAVPRPGGFYAYREHFAPQYAEYAEPAEWVDDFSIKEEWHTGETPARAKVTLRIPNGNYPRVEAIGTSREHVEKALHDAAAQVKAERAGIA